MKTHIVKNLINAEEAELKEYGDKYPDDIGKLYDSYKKLKTQDWSEDFLNGYLAVIHNLIIIKKGHWA